MADLGRVSVLDWLRDLWTPSSTNPARMWWETLQAKAHDTGHIISKPLWETLFGTESGNIHGPDVSRWQGEVDWEAVRATGASFAFSKATEGVGWEDPRFQENWAEMARVGLVRGAYHFARVSLRNYGASPAQRLDDVAHDARAEANWFVDVVHGNEDPEPGDLPLVLDIEWDKKAKGVKPSEICHFCEVFSLVVEARTGRKPIIYTGPSFWRYKLGKSLDLNNHALWLVDGYCSPAGQPKRPIPGWDWTFHQYTNTHPRPDGKSDKMDWNIFRGRRADLAQLCGVALSAWY